MLFMTFIGGAVMSEDEINGGDEEDDAINKILLKTISILDMMLDKKMHYEFFLSNKIDIVFALLMYSRVTNQ